MSMISRIKSDEEISLELERMCRQILTEHHVDVDIAVLKTVVQDMLYDRVVKDLHNRLADWSSPSLLGLHARLEEKEQSVKGESTEVTEPKLKRTRAKRNTMN